MREARGLRLSLLIKSKPLSRLDFDGLFAFLLSSVKRAVNRRECCNCCCPTSRFCRPKHTEPGWATPNQLGKKQSGKKSHRTASGDSQWPSEFHVSSSLPICWASPAISVMCSRAFKLQQNFGKSPVAGQRVRVPGQLAIDSMQPFICAVTQGYVRGFQHHQVPGISLVLGQLRSEHRQQRGARLLQQLLRIDISAAVMHLLRQHFQQVGHAPVSTRSRQHSAALRSRGAICGDEVVDVRLLAKTSGVVECSASQLGVRKPGELIFHRGDRTDRRLTN